jgi:hypothetical protein
MNYIFPFGSELKKVEQQNKSPKEVFVLGVYASAVHARWIDHDDKIKVLALAAASEPSIFWRGNKEKVVEIINEIKIPYELGKLEPAEPRFNGISGRLLDKDYLDPLGYSRKQAWQTFKRPLVSQRCIVIADAFIEWSSSTKQPYLIYMRNRERPFGMEGLYDIWIL